MSSRQRFVAALSIACVTVVVVAVMALAGTSSPPIPPWIGSDGTIDMSRVPDQVPIGGPTGQIVGFADKSALYSLPDTAPEEVNAPQTARYIPVHDARGRQVGYLVDDRGFVACANAKAPIPKC
jgi:hypothetical protein